MMDHKAATLSVETLVWMARQGGKYAEAAEQYATDLVWLVRAEKRNSWTEGDA